MLKIYKVNSHHVVDFAAEELKKYLRMMMPDTAEIEIIAEGEKTDGFRLGLLSDFDLPSEAEDPYLDDVIHVETDENGGILAGSNPRSILFAVYRFLRENGCRWLYPGVDGEYVPVKNIVPISYHKLADHRFRGHCNEGAESQQCMLDTIDFYAKQECNVYMIEFDVPHFYYNSYYSHQYNDRVRRPERIDNEQVLQWKRLCEVEISKRGLQFHDMGHGWTAEPYGFNSAGGWKKDAAKENVENFKYLAELNGVRGFFRGVPLNTNICMSNPEARGIMANAVVDYAVKHQNVDYLHVWLADGSRNHCECEECKKMRPSDWYLMIMNEIDEKLTALGLNTRVVFISYVDTLFSPETVTIKNPSRFSLLWAPITRSYTSSVTEDTVIPEEAPYLRNAWEKPVGIDANAAHLKAWQKSWKGPCFSYEYHFWKHQYWDVGGMAIAKRIWEDIRSLKYLKLDGYVEDGSQRSFFPNGFAIYIYAETLMNRECDFETVAEDYFSHLYGEKWREVLSYFDRTSKLFDFAFMSGQKSIDPAVSLRYNPDMAKSFEAVPELAAEGRALVKDLIPIAKTRPQWVSLRLLELHTEYIEGVKDFMLEKCLGNEQISLDKFREFFLQFGAHEYEIERYFDHYLAAKSFFYVLNKPKTPPLQTGN